jgi:hypothetical protein
MKKMILFLLLLTAAPAAFANNCSVDTFVIEPNPVTSMTTDAMVTLKGTCGASNIPHSPVVRVLENNTIEIELQSAEGGLAVLAEWGERVRLPMLQAGTYRIVVKTWLEEMATQTLNVVAQPFTVTPAHGHELTQVLLEGVSLPCPSNPCPALEVFFGEVKATEMTFTGAGLVVTPPRQAAGVVNVRVQRGSASVTALNAFRYGQPFEGDVERVLFPVNLMARGAFGSDWATDIVVRNDGPIAVETIPLFWSDPASPVLPIPMPIISGGRSNFGNRNRDGGDFLYTPLGLERNLSYASHVVDRSRAEADLGTEIPVVRDEDAAPVIKLLEVPVDPRFRAKLRVYNLDENKPVFLTFRDPVTGRTVQQALQLTGYQVCPNAPCFSERPAFGVIDLDAIPDLRTMQNGVDVTISSSTNDARLWAFVTVTNNETQHVTVYTPQHRRRAQ